MRDDIATLQEFSVITGGPAKVTAIFAEAY
jgi:hypothetical protein